MINEVAARLLIEGGALGILVFLVLSQGRQATADRKEASKQLDKFLDFLTKQRVHDDARSASRMAEGLDGLSQVNGTVREMTAAMVELGKAMAAHEARNSMGQDDIASSISLVIEKLDRALARPPR